MEFKTQPYAHQQAAFDKCIGLDYFALLADMGVGKTKIAIDVAAYHHFRGALDRVLVIAPNSVHAQWITEQFPLHCPADWEGFSFQGSNKTNTYLRKLDRFLLMNKGNAKLLVFTMNIEAFARATGLELAEQFIRTSNKPPAIYIDEASRIKNPEAKSVMALCKLRDKFPASLRAVITGTPAAKSPVDMWSIYDFLSKRYMGCSYPAFKAEHAVIVKKKIEVKNRLITIEAGLDIKTYTNVKNMIKANAGDNNSLSEYAVAEIKHRFGLSDADFWFIAGSKEFQKNKNLDRLKAHIEPVTFTANKKDCLDLPDKVYELHEFELNMKQKKLIKELTKYSATVYDGAALTVEVKALLGMRVLQICGGFFSHLTDIEGEFGVTPITGQNLKLEFLKKDIPEIGEQQFVTWAVFTPEIALLTKELSKITEVGRLDGSVKEAQRAQVIQDFKDGNLQGLISHPEVGGYGLNLQMASVQYWYSRNYRNEARLQAEDRSHRSGIVKSPVYKDLLYNIPWEHQVLAVNKEGADLNSIFMGHSIDELFKLK